MRSLAHAKRRAERIDARALPGIRFPRSTRMCHLPPGHNSRRSLHDSESRLGVKPRTVLETRASPSVTLAPIRIAGLQEPVPGSQLCLARPGRPSAPRGSFLGLPTTDGPLASRAQISESPGHTRRRGNLSTRRKELPCHPLLLVSPSALTPGCSPWARPARRAAWHTRGDRDHPQELLHRGIQESRDHPGEPRHRQGPQVKPNPPSKDGDLHVAGRTEEVGLPIVAEIMNAKFQKAVGLGLLVAGGAGLGLWADGPMALLKPAAAAVKSNRGPIWVLGLLVLAIASGTIRHFSREKPNERVLRVLLLMIAGVLALWCTAGLGAFMVERAARSDGTVSWIVSLGTLLAAYMEVYCLYLAWRSGLHRDKPSRKWPEGELKVA